MISATDKDRQDSQRQRTNDQNDTNFLPRTAKEGKAVHDNELAMIPGISIPAGRFHQFQALAVMEKATAGAVTYRLLQPLHRLEAGPVKLSARYRRQRKLGALNCAISD